MRAALRAKTRSSTETSFDPNMSSLTLLLLTVVLMPQGAGGEANLRLIDSHPIVALTACLRLRGGSQPDRDMEAFKRELERLNEMQGGEEGYDAEVRSSDISEGTDSSEWISPRARELMSGGQSKRAAPAVAQVSTPMPKKKRAEVVEEETVQAPEDLPLGDGARYDRQTREHLVSKHDAKAGMRVSLSTRALVNSSRADFFSRYRGLVGVLEEPVDERQLAWWVKFPGFPCDFFMTGQENEFHLAYAREKNVGFSSKFMQKHASSSLSSLPGLANRSRLVTDMLWNATMTGDVDGITEAIMAGADVNSKRMVGAILSTPLHQAIFFGNHLVLARLLAHNANIKMVDEYGATPLHHAAARGDSQAVLTLLDSGASLEAKTSMGFTALHLAAQACSQECMHSLISKGADVNALDHVRTSPLHIAVQLESPACVQQLLLAGANLRVKTIDGTTPIDLASQQQDKKLYNQLRKILSLQEEGKLKDEHLAIRVLVSVCQQLTAEEAELQDNLLKSLGGQRGLTKRGDSAGAADAAAAGEETKSSAAKQEEEERQQEKNESSESSSESEEETKSSSPSSLASQQKENEEEGEKFMDSDELFPKLAV
mmetsp:Transcript_43521/g.137679  ORF Transcript_43521/g.137679 Transcript_43521/m.137679 type:complete len:601 (-) Transcript_43521:1548-3350(-)